MSTETPDAEAAVPTTKSFTRTPTSWDASDDILLMHLKDNQKLGWKEIASHFNNRTPNACQFRWRRLKSGNLKNPPKSAAAISGADGAGTGAGASSRTGAKTGARTSSSPRVKTEDVSATGSPRLSGAGLPGTGVSATGSDTSADSRRPSVSSETDRKGPGSKKRRISELSTGIGSVYSPLSNTTFTGYDTVSTALAGLNALSHTNGGPHAGNGPHGPINTTSHPQTFENSPKSDVALDPQSHSAAAGSSGGYFTDISVDPTSNLPHNKPHPVPNSQSMTPRNSATDHNFQLLHSNSIIQIVRDDRASVSSQSRHSVSSLPSKSMDIPHHHRNSLVHLPVLFGGSSISGPSGMGPSSVSGPSGIPHLASTLSSIRNGSIVGPPSQTYLRRSSMSTVNGDRRLSEKDRDRKLDKEKSAEPGRRGPSPSWDELLINRRRKELSFAELSILLPQRTEGEIWARIDALERLKNGHRASVSRARRHRQSSLGLDDVDDFYDDVDSVIDGMDSDDDDNDDVLLDVDDSISGHHRMSKKRRASSAVNPLSVREGIRSRLR
ncbi:hypothetical protein JCM33374_g4339 [Metschnikowia sp. JCM 33374]|nr:hypothetical protein JCM33374_g4339 [Metschnikowia sp. JCM 33374]